MERTEWLLGDVSVLEPITALTDFIITAVCLVAYVKLRRTVKTNGGYLPHYPHFFLTMGLCTFFAALMSHAFPYSFVEPLLSKEQIALLPWTDKFAYHIHDMPNWLFNVTSASLFELALVDRAADIAPNISRRRWLSLITVESFVVLVLLFYFLDYNVAAAHIAFTLYVVLVPLQLMVKKYHFFTEQKLLLIGAGVMLVSGPVMATKFQISPWFNHNDISHILIATSMFIFFKSALISLQNGIYTLETADHSSR
ncbi:MAG: hypothetical protein K6F33_06820 [Bacteroidales bacterium]|nr:hypothetical protein [Bacteroidales bacterium]